MNADEVMRRLMDGNRRFVRGDRAPRDFPARRVALLAGQNPLAAIVACSDSRVVPEFIFDADLGEVFDVESAGNVVDEVGLGSIEYAVRHLETPVLVVLGHTRCGAVTACCRPGGGEGQGRLSAVLERIAPAAERSGRIVDEAIEENVRAVCEYVRSESAVVRERIAEGKLRVVPAVYVMETGEVRLLEGGGPTRRGVPSP
jgi:carbonic anhydrase